VYEAISRPHNIMDLHHDSDDDGDIVLFGGWLDLPVTLRSINGIKGFKKSKRSIKALRMV
jgi:hypothetical protein